MADVFSDDYWQEEFEVTTDDLERIVKRMREKRAAFTLTEITERLIRGRLEHGEDTSTAALPKWVQEQKVLSWDAEEQWEIGSRVLVARMIDKEIAPFLGVIVEKSSDIFFIRLEKSEEIVKYGRTRSPEETKKRFETIRRSIAKKERTAKQKQIRGETSEFVEVILLEHGARVTTRLSTALENDNRFLSVGDRWFLEDQLVPLSQYQLKKLHQRMLTEGESLTFAQMLPLVDPPLPTDDIGMFSLHEALENEPNGLFKEFDAETQSKWKAVQPPPPTWDQALAGFYVYDPRTYEVILQPGQPLKQYVAERLQELGIYEQVVSARAS